MTYYPLTATLPDAILTKGPLLVITYDFLDTLLAFIFGAMFLEFILITALQSVRRGVCNGIL